MFNFKHKLTGRVVPSLNKVPTDYHHEFTKTEEESTHEVREKREDDTDDSIFGAIGTGLIMSELLSSSSLDTSSQSDTSSNDFGGGDFGGAGAGDSW